MNLLDSDDSGMNLYLLFRNGKGCLHCVNGAVPQLVDSVEDVEEQKIQSGLSSFRLSNSQCVIILSSRNRS